MNSDRTFYVYAHKTPRSGRVFYVGKGKARRAWSRSGRNAGWRKVATDGFDTVIVRDGMNEACAFSFERIVISANKAKGLVNKVDGGGGTSGWRHSEETKKRIGAFWKGRKITRAMREALEHHNATRVLTDETRKNMSAAARRRKRRPHSAETKAKIAASHVGLRPSAKSRRKMSLAKIGKAVGRNSPSYDHTIRKFRHDSGEIFTGTRADFIAKFGLRHGCVSALISGRQKSIKGWRLA